MKELTIKIHKKTGTIREVDTLQPEKPIIISSINQAEFDELKDSVTALALDNTELKNQLDSLSVSK